MSVTLHGIAYAFGISLSYLDLPILNIPPGTTRLRLRMRSHEYMTAWVRTPEGITRYYLIVESGGLTLSMPSGANHTVPCA